MRKGSFASYQGFEQLGKGRLSLSRALEYCEMAYKGKRVSLCGEMNDTQLVEMFGSKGILGNICS